MYRYLSFLIVLIATTATSFAREAQTNPEPFEYEGFYITAEYLLWKTLHDNLDYIGRGSTFPGKIQESTYDWSSGFRVGAGYSITEDWDVQVVYTYLSPSGHDHVRGDNLFLTSTAQFIGWGQFVDSLLQTNPPQPPFVPAELVERIDFLQLENIIQEAKSDIHLHYNILDVESITEFPFSNHFKFGILYGIRAAFLREDWENKFLGLLVDETDLPFPSLIKLNDGWKYDGGGIRAGIRGNVLLGWGFSMRTSLNLSLLVGRMRVHYDHRGEVDDVIDILANVFEESYRARGSESFTTLIPNIEALIGVGNEIKFRKSMILDLFVGYEMSYWINLGQFRRNLNRGAIEFSFSETEFEEGNFLFSENQVVIQSKENSKSPQSIALHGLTARATFKF